MSTFPQDGRQQSFRSGKKLFPHRKQGVDSWLVLPFLCWALFDVLMQRLSLSGSSLCCASGEKVMRAQRRASEVLNRELWHFPFKRLIHDGWDCA